MSFGTFILRDIAEIAAFFLKIQVKDKMLMEKECTPFFWIDLEMTGLDVNVHHILEVALVVTDEKFNVLETFESVVYQTDEVLEKMDPWCVQQHAKTGLTQKIPSGLPLLNVERQLIDIVQKYSPNKQAIIAGNSIHQDRKFIDTWMENLSKLLHYRMCDVSSFKIIFEAKYKKKFKKQNKHRALDDIYESIAELKFYLQSFEKDCLLTE